jgi:kumamolisin
MEKGTLMFPRLLAALAAVIALLAASIAPSTGATTTRVAFASLSPSLQLAHGYMPDQLATAYDLGPLTAQGLDGAGQTIALIEYDKFAKADIQRFDAAASLPAPNLTQTYVGGKSFKMPNAGEATMDVEWAHAMAPGAKLHVYYLKNGQPDRQSWNALASAIQLAVNNGAGTISMSFGTCGPTPGYEAVKSALAGAMQRGVSTFVSSGDDGAMPGPARDCGRDPGVAYPASDPSVAAVGGTSLSLHDDNTISDESAWSGSGGGEGSPVLRPVWQLVSQLPQSKYRLAPDVAFLGDPRTGAAVAYKGRWVRAGGTSLGAPAWAGIWSLIRQDGQISGKTMSAAPPLLYSIAVSSAYARAFHDITEGGNSVYAASSGWDEVTGWGSPDVAGLAAAALTAPATR